MSEREELIKRLQKMAHDYYVFGGWEWDALNDAISALSAQQSQQGPKEPTEPVAMEGYWWCPNCKAEIGAYHVTYQEYHEDCGHKVEWITPDTAPLSGVREGMMRAPWPDFLGQPIYHGDRMSHPDGNEFIAIRLGTDDDSWRAVYGEDGAISRLSLQVGDKGQAFVVTRAADQVNAEEKS